MSRNLMQTALRALLASLILIGGLSACGQKGPLYLPEDRPQENTSSETESNS